MSEQAQHPKQLSSRPTAERLKKGAMRQSALQPKTAGLRPTPAAQGIARSTPVAPPVYRPQPASKILQAKTAQAAQKTRQPNAPPNAPPVYRPQPVPVVLQRKSALSQQSTASRLPGQPVAPPVYRPQPTMRVLQTKQSLNSRLTRNGVIEKKHSSIQRARVAQASTQVKMALVHLRGGISPQPPHGTRASGVVQRAEMKNSAIASSSSSSGASPDWYYCAQCKNTLVSNEYPDFPCPKCGAAYSWAEGEPPSDNNQRPWVAVVKSAEKESHKGQEAIQQNAVDKKAPKSRPQFNDYPLKIQTLITHCKTVVSYLAKVNTAEDLYDIVTVSKLDFTGEKDIITCYTAIYGMMSAIAGFGDEEWAVINMLGVGGILLAWLKGPKRCITSLAQDLLRNLV